MNNYGYPRGEEEEEEEEVQQTSYYSSTKVIMPRTRI